MKKLAIPLGAFMFWTGCASTDGTRVSRSSPEIDSTIPAVGAPAMSVYGTGAAVQGGVGMGTMPRNDNTSTLYNSSSTTGIGATTPRIAGQSGSAGTSATGTIGSRYNSSAPATSDGFANGSVGTSGRFGSSIETQGSAGSATGSGYPGSSLNRQNDSGSPATSSSGVNSNRATSGFLTGTQSQDSTNPRSTTNSVNQVSGVNGAGGASPSSAAQSGTSGQSGNLGGSGENTSTNSLSSGNTPGSSTPGR